MRSLLPVAASLLLFIGGAEYGRRTAQRATPESGPGSGMASGATAGVTSLPSADEQSLPISIQAAGSRYVASLARLSGSGPDLSAEQRQVALEVALAAFYGAAIELVQESQDDELLREVAELVERRRSQMRVTAVNAGRGL